MKRAQLAICDSNRTYCERLSEYLRNSLNFSFEIISFTEGEKLLAHLENAEVSLLIISHRHYENLGKEIPQERTKNIIVLVDDEDTTVPPGDERVRYVSRLLPASEIVRQVIDICTGRPEDFRGIVTRKTDRKCLVTGLYTPIPGCGQQALALSLGEALSGRGKSLLLSFEGFSPLTMLFDAEAKEDLMDLFYHADCNPESFPLHLERMRLNRKGLDIIKPAATPMQLREVTADRVKELISLLSEAAGYENVILDLREYPDSFFEILDLCDVIYMIEGTGSGDQRRISLYNQSLVESGFEDIPEKTVKCRPGDSTGPNGQWNAGALIRQGLEVTGPGA